MSTQRLPSINTASTKWIHVISLLLLIFMSAPLVEAAEGKRIAFVVGINTYDHLAKERQLENAVRDAREISRTLKHVGFEVVEGIDVTISDFDKKWQAVLKRMTSEDTLVFFFSGHGVEVDGENLLLPRDIPYFEFGRDKQFQRRAVSVAELMKDLRTGDRQHPKVTVMILDACRENPTIPPEYRTKGGMPQGGLAKVPKTRGTFMLYAAEPGKLSLDRLGPLDKHPNSVYTRSLLPLLEQANLPIQDLAIKVKEQVYALTEKVGYEQLPEYTDGLIGPFCLAGCASKVDKGTGGVKGDFTATVQPYLHREIPGKDGAPMVLVPAGEFMMGSREDGKMVGNDERPAHSVYLDAFYIDQYEVTTAQYAKFLKAGSRSEPQFWAANVMSDHARKPVIGVDWSDATAYCSWAGKRLPTEAEWEKAARGTDQRLYPWGSAAPSQTFSNFDHCCNIDFREYGSLTDVGSFEQGKSPYGAYDMAGNVWEWVADWYDENYYKNSPARNPTGPSSGQYRVLHGGSWVHGPEYVRSAIRYRATATKRNDALGFRCAQDRPN